MFTILDCDYSNHTILHKNRKESRVHFIPFSDMHTAHTTCVLKSDRITMLRGDWDFEWFSSPLDVTKEIIEKKTLENKIEVPLNWQFAGFGKFCYTDVWYPFPVNPPFIPLENETGVYKRTFTLTSPIQANTAIRFEGVESAFHLYINGKNVGYSQGSRMPSEFDITNYVFTGKNEICVVVYQYSDGTYLEDQDMLWLGGIIRDVYLIHRTNAYIENLILDPDFDTTKDCGILNVFPKTIGCDAIDITIYDNKKILKTLTIKSGIKTVIEIENIKPWTAETPNLYLVCATITDKNNTIQEIIPQKIGFRHIEIYDGTLLLNGQKILMKGINRHEFDSKRGRAVTYEKTLSDLTLIKSANINAIRTSHYPNNPYVYDICNEIGLYLIDECDLETHGFEIINKSDRLCADPEWKEAYIDRIERMVERDRNYACIILWSLGNESFFGENFKAMYAWCKKNEPTRPIHYEEDRKNEIVDVSSTMYSTIGTLKELDTNIYPKRPHIICEYAHAMGNGPGSLKEYFEVCENSKRIQGLFIWEFCDHSVYHKRKDGKVEYLFGGEFGEKFHNGNFCLDGMIMANGKASPGFYEYKKVIENAHIISFDKKNMTFTLKNRYDFLTLAHATCTCTIKCDEKTIDTYTLTLPPFLPHDTKRISIGKELTQYKKNALITIDIDFIAHTKTACCNKGDSIGSHREVLYDYIPQSLPPSKKNIRLTENNNNILIQGENFSFTISLIDGRILNYTTNNEILIKKGPLLNYYRAYIDNDIKNAKEWNTKHLHSMQMTIYSVKHKKIDTTLHISITGRFAPQALYWGTNVTIHYTIYGDGTVNLNFKGIFDGDTPEELPKLGTQMHLTKSLSNLTYCGLGDGENYCDSQENAKFGIYTQTAQDMFVNYPYPQDNGNRHKVQFVVLQNDTSGLVIGSKIAKDFSIRDIEDDNLQKCTHSCDLEHKDYLIVNYDIKNSGLGSASCGPKALAQYKCHPINFNFSFIIAPLSSDDIIGNGRKAISYDTLLQ